MTGNATAKCTDSIAEIKSAHAHIRLNVEVADSAEERAIGLMHRDSMPYNSGMWFIYETPRTVAFWMRNTPQAFRVKVQKLISMILDHLPSH